MVFVIPDSSKNVKTMEKSQQKSDIIAKDNVAKSENSIPAKTQASKSVLSNTIATSTPSKSGFQTKKKKKKEADRAGFLYNEISRCQNFSTCGSKGQRYKLWHSHEDSIRNRIQLRQEKFEEKLAVKKVDEENRKLDEAKKKSRMMKKKQKNVPENKSWKEKNVEKESKKKKSVYC